MCVCANFNNIKWGKRLECNFVVKSQDTPQGVPITFLSCSETYNFRDVKFFVHSILKTYFIRLKLSRNLGIHIDCRTSSRHDGK